jgi:hypothetical protein
MISLPGLRYPRPKKDEFVKTHEYDGYGKRSNARLANPEA